MRFGAGALKDGSDVAFGLTYVLVEQLRALDGQEVTAVRAGRLAERMCHRLGDERLSTTGRAVEQQSARGLQGVLAVQLRVANGQFNGVADALNLPFQTTDGRKVNVRNLFEQQRFHAGALHLLRGKASARIDDDRVAFMHAKVGVATHEHHHALVFTARHHQQAFVVDDFANDGGLARTLRFGYIDHHAHGVE